jgi:hypothetical protein
VCCPFPTKQRRHIMDRTAKGTILSHLPCWGEMRSAWNTAVSEERLGYGERHADTAPRGHVPGHLVSTPPFVSPWCPAVGHKAKQRVRVWCSLPMLGSRAPRQRYAIPVYVIYRYMSIYIGIQCGSATRLALFFLRFPCLQQSMRSAKTSKVGCSYHLRQGSSPHSRQAGVMRPGLTAGALGPSTVSLNTNNPPPPPPPRAMIQGVALRPPPSIVSVRGRDNETAYDKRV